MQKLCLPAVQKTFLALFKPCSQKCKNVYIQKHILTNLFGADKFETHLTKQDNEEWAEGWARNEISSHNKTTIKQDSFGKQRPTCDFPTGNKICVVALEGPEDKNKRAVMLSTIMIWGCFKKVRERGCSKTFHCLAPCWKMSFVYD